MPTLPPAQFRPATARLVARLVAPLTDSGLVTLPEYEQIVSALRGLAKRGGMVPVIPPRLVDGKAAAEMLGISYSQFRTLEAEGEFPFKRRLVGSKTVRYLNTDLLAYMGALPAVSDEAAQSTAIFGDGLPRTTIAANSPRPPTERKSS